MPARGSVLYLHEVKFRKVERLASWPKINQAESRGKYGVAGKSLAAMKTIVLTGWFLAPFRCTPGSWTAYDRKVERNYTKHAYPET